MKTAADRNPTPLFTESERRPIEIREASPSRFRVVQVARRLGPALARLALGWATGRLRPEEAGRLLREPIERLGGLWVKFAQLLSLRHDLYGAEFCHELMRVQDRAVGFPGDGARRIVEEDLGAPIEAIFSSFTETPVAAASIGQVHRATLRKEGVVVAVKVQRPGIRATFERDMRLIAGFVGILRRFASFRRLRLEDIAVEFQSAIQEELDYRREAYYIRQMRRVLSGMKVISPRTWKRYNRARVLVMEYLEGVFMSDVLAVQAKDPDRLARWLTENDVEPGKVGRRLYRAFLRMVLDEPFFHSDLHPGNVMVFRGGRLGLIDFGAVGMLHADFRRPLCEYLRAIGERDFVDAIDRMMFLFEPIPPMDIDEFKREMLKVLRQWDANTRLSCLPFNQRSAVYLYGEFGRVARTFGVPISWTYLRVDRANFTMSVSLSHLSPDISFPKEMRNVTRRIVGRALRRLRPDPDRLRGTMLAVRNAATRIAGASGGVESMMRRSSLGIQATTSKASFALASAFRSVRLALDALGLFLLAAFVHQVVVPLPLDATPLSVDDLVLGVPELGRLDWVAVALLYASVRRAVREALEILGRKEGGSYGL